MDARSIVLSIAFAAMWASGFTSAKFIVADAPPLTALALRFAISGILAVAIAGAMGQGWRLDRRQWRLTILFGLCQNALYLGLNFMAMRTIDAGLASIMASTMPIWVALFGWAALGERLRPATVLGLLAGFTGVTIIMGSRISGGVDPGGLGLSVLAVMALTVATLSLRGASSGGNVLMVVGLQMLVGAAALAIAGLVFEPWEVNWSTSLVVAFVYTTLVPGLAATFVWFVLVRQIGPVRAATFHFLTPFLGAAMAAALLDEDVSALDLFGVAIIMLGILAVQLSRPRSRV
ncbi:DMT family transporter [Palleronia sp. LCG004]|uniref:DMT family transporter n=1 Tax=Palleronia sp. LCG004 TaxID=3079304 RepID=UPI0029422B43|nr:DMT family transporter [Palleronia sp. LCG004]WOI55581.1 DMT family transporter [Palleronia sp. LCG004]